jgi:hypothetical protein
MGCLVGLLTERKDEDPNQHLKGFNERRRPMPMPTFRLTHDLLIENRLSLSNVTMSNKRG